MSIFDRSCFIPTSRIAKAAWSGRGEGITVDPMGSRDRGCCVFCF